MSRWIARLPVGEPGAGLTAGVRRFLRDLSYLFAADTGVTLLTFPVTVWLIRRLGPDEFGRANLAMTVAQFCLVPALLGVPAAAMHYLARTDGERRCLGSALTSSALVAALVLPVLAAARTVLGPALRVDPVTFAWGVAFAAPLAAGTVTQSVLGGLRVFPRLSLYQFAAGLCFLAAAAGVLWLVPRPDFRHIVGLNSLRTLVFAGFALWMLVPLAGRPSLAWTRSLLGLGWYHTLAALAHLFTVSTITTILLNAYHGPTSVGVFSAYLVVFNVFVSQFMRLLSAVLQPTASAHHSPVLLTPRLVGLFGRGVLPLLAVSIVGSWVLFRLYGPTYAFSWPSALLMSLGLAATVLSGVLGDLLVACGVAGTRWLTWSSLATAAVNVGLGVLLVPAYAVDGALAATCCSAATAVILRRGALTALSRRARAGLA